MYIFMNFLFQITELSSGSVSGNFSCNRTIKNGYRLMASINKVTSDPLLFNRIGECAAKALNKNITALLQIDS